MSAPARDRGAAWSGRVHHVYLAPEVAFGSKLVLPVVFAWVLTLAGSAFLRANGLLPLR